MSHWPFTKRESIEVMLEGTLHACTPETPLFGCAGFHSQSSLTPPVITFEVEMREICERKIRERERQREAE